MSMTADRAFVRDELRKLMPTLSDESDVRTRAYCVREVTVFVPSELLESGLELLDIPGVNDSDDLNKGLAMEVKSHTVVGNVIELFLEIPFTITVGDKIIIYAGCDKRLETCIDKFDNIVNMRAEPYVPGQDEFFNTPDAR